MAPRPSPAAVSVDLQCFPGYVNADACLIEPSFFVSGSKFMAETCLPGGLGLFVFVGLKPIKRARANGSHTRSKFKKYQITWCLSNLSTYQVVHTSLKFCTLY